MKRVTIFIEGIAPYSASRGTDDNPRADRETHEDYDQRIWREKANVTPEGKVCIPAMAFKQAMDTTAYKLGEKVPNRRGATFKNFFVSGLICEADAVLHVNGKILTRADAEPVTISANSDGVRGSGKRVPRTFPVFRKWECEVVMIVTDDILTQAIIEQHARAAGIVAGVGRFRPEKGGPNGRFRVKKFAWEDFKL